MNQTVDSPAIPGRRKKNHSLFLAFSVPFMIQLLILAGLIGYLSYKNGQETISDLAGRLMTEIGMRIDQDLNGYFQKLEQITRSNAYLIKKERLSPSDISGLRERFMEQLENAYLVNSAALATEEGDFVALERDDISLIWRVHDKTRKVFSSFRLDENGHETEQTGAIIDFDPHRDPPHDPWYEKARSAKEAVWLVVVSLAKGMENPELHIVNFLPFYSDAGHMMGVTASSIYLSHFNQFLSRLKVGKTGQSFVMDRQGLLVATSSGEIPFIRKDDPTYEESVEVEKRRLSVLVSHNPVTRAGAKAILGRYHAFEKAGQADRFDFEYQNQRYFIQMIPVKKNNLDWLTVIIVPETDFMEHIQKNTRFNIVLAVLAIILAFGLGLFTTRWVTRPILRLNAAARQISRGQWDEPVPVHRDDEIGELADTFRHMADNLKAMIVRLQKEISEKEQMTETLRISEERFRKLLQSIPEIAIQGYRLDGTTTYWNEASERFYGYSAQEAIGRNLLDLIIPPEMREEVRASMELMAKTGNPIPSEEVSLVTRDGSRVTVFSNHALVQMAGQLTELFCLDIDLTRRRQAEEALKRLIEEQDILLNHMDIQVWYLKGIDTYGAVNKAHAAFFNKQRADLEYRSFQEVFPSGSGLDQYIADNRQVFEGKCQTRTEAWVVNGDRESRLLAVTRTPKLSPTGQVEYVVCFASDITEARKMQEIMIQTEKMISVGGIAAGIAHEINNPLGIILQNIQNIERRMQPDFPKNLEEAEAIGLDMDLMSRYVRQRKVDKFIQDIKTAGIRAADIIRHMLDFSRRSESRKAVCDFIEIVKGALNLARNDYDLKKNYDFRKIQIDLEAEPDLPKIECIATEIEQVLLNLFRNAAQAMTEAGSKVENPCICIRISAIPERDGIRVEISDNGPGILSEHQARIFEPFFTTKAKGQGTGLGLSVSHAIITRNHGGSMAVTSPAGSGACFVIELPRLSRSSNEPHKG